MDLVNPYNPTGERWEDNHTVQCRVSQEDFFFIKQRFPFYNGLFDKILASLYKLLLDELRKIDSETPIETALYVGDPSYQTLAATLTRIQIVERRSIGEPSSGGSPSPRNDERGTRSVRATVQPNAEQRTDEKGDTPPRKRNRKNTKKKEVQR